MFKKLSLELGGKNASIVLDDADLEIAVPGVLRSSSSIPDKFACAVLESSSLFNL